MCSSDFCKPISFESQAVKRQLVGAGIRGDRLCARGFGSTKTVIENNSPENRPDG